MRLTWGGFNSSKEAGGIKTNAFNTENRNLVVSKYYVEMGFLVNSRHIFGFGERQGQFELKTGEYTSWANGRDNHFDDGKLGGHSYGDHPFVLTMLNDGTYAGIFFKNSNAKVLQYTHVGKAQSVLNFKAIGGILDFFTFTGETAEDVLLAYQRVIGSPYFPPFWALGFHQSAWRYNKTKDLDYVLEQYDMHEIPLESIWLDIEYMDRYRNFIVDQTRFPKLKATAAALHTKYQKIVAIVDAGFGADDDYTYYREFNENKLFIKQANSTENLFGKVWPGKSAFPDFLNPKTQDRWVNALKGLYTQAGMDGIWIDMNEVTNFCDGQCQKTLGIPDVKDLPYNPMGNGTYNIQSMSLSVDGQHYYKEGDDAAKENNIEYNVHSLFGHLEAKATHQFWMDETAVGGRRPFVLSRSTFAGSGKYTSHWLGDNFSKWEDMRYSIAGIMSFNMFGIPLVGADVCGFHNNFEDEMCARWFQLSSFYPFARNHYNLTDNGGAYLKPQEAYELKAPFNETAKSAIIQRYCYLRYFYTLLYEISTSKRAMLVKPLSFLYPTDLKTLQSPEHTFLVGDSLKISPVLTPEDSKKLEVKSYFPKNSRFISLNDMTTIVEGGKDGVNKTLSAPLSYTNVHLREGRILPYQDATEKRFDRTYYLINNDGIDIMIFPDKNGYAEGSLYIDKDGDDQYAYESGAFEYYLLRYANRTLSIELIDGRGADGDRTIGNHVIQNVYVLGIGAKDSPTRTSCAYLNNMSTVSIGNYVNEAKGYLKMNVTNGNPLTFHETHSIQFALDSAQSTFCNPKYTVGSVNNHIGNDGFQKRTLVVKSEAGSQLPNFNVTFTLIKNNVVRIEVEDSANPAFRVTDKVFNPNFPTSESVNGDIASVINTPKEGQEFFFEVHEYNNPNNVLYSTKGQSFVQSPTYMKTTAMINSNGKIFGMAERVGDFFLVDGVYTLWARDEPSPIENGKRPGKNVYGTHPVYFTHLKSGNNFFAVFDNNAGAQDFIIDTVGTNKRITHIKTSGMTDMFIILNESIKNVTAEFINLVGKPVMVPEWSLGWHQCRYGYNNSAQVRDVVNNYTENMLPLDAMWTDIEYMDMYKDFTVSQSDFADLPLLVDQWKTKNIHYVPILDAAIAYEEKSKDTSYERGTKLDIFIQDPVDKTKPFIGKVWPGSAVYIDWLKQESQTFWMTEMAKLFEKLKFDGMWIDMNEASNFCDGS